MQKKKVVFLTVLTLINVFLAATIVLSFSFKKDDNNNKIIYPDYYTEALKDEKPVFLFFYADWCSHCVNFIPTYNELEKYYKEKYNFIKVNIDNPENMNLVQDFYVRGIPMVYVIETKSNKKFLINNYLLHDMKALKTNLNKFIKGN